MGGSVLGGLDAALLSTSAKFEALASTAENATARIGAATAKTNQAITEAVTKANAGLAEIDKGVEAMDNLVSPRLHQFIAQLEQARDSGSGIAEQLLDSINQVLAGTLEADKVITAFGEAQTDFEGRAQSLKDVLLAILPTTGQVQGALREFLKDARPTEELLGRLQNANNVLAQQFAALFSAFEQGRASLAQLEALAAQIKNALPGSETAQIIDKILSNADRGGRL